MASSLPFPAVVRPEFRAGSYHISPKVLTPACHEVNSPRSCKWKSKKKGSKATALNPAGVLWFRCDCAVTPPPCTLDDTASYDATSTGKSCIPFVSRQEIYRQGFLEFSCPQDGLKEVFL